MKFALTSHDVGLIPYLVARFFQSLRKQISGVLSHVFYATIPLTYARYCKPAAGTRLKSYNIHETNYCFDAIPMLRSIVRR